MCTATTEGLARHGDAQTSAGCKSRKFQWYAEAIMPRSRIKSLDQRAWAQRKAFLTCPRMPAPRDSFCMFLESFCLLALFCRPLAPPNSTTAACQNQLFCEAP